MLVELSKTELQTIYSSLEYALASIDKYNFEYNVQNRKKHPITYLFYQRYKKTKEKIINYIFKEDF